MARSTHQNDGQNDQQGSGNLPSLRYPVPSGNGNTQSTGSENKYECLVAEYTGNLAVFTRWLVIVTGLLVIVTGGLVSFSRRQIADARAVQRAYVFVLAPKCDFDTDATGNVVGLRLSVTWKNSGITPASNILSVVGAAWVESENQFRFGEIDQNTVLQPIVLGPGAEMSSTGIGISPEHLYANMNQRGFQFLSGWARYRDIFPGSREHVVEFCFRVTLERVDPGRPYNGRINFAFYGEHNRHYDA